MKKFILLMVFTLIASVGFVFGQSRSMAVMPFDVIGNAVTADEAEAITELYISALIEVGKVKIVDRANFDKVMKELNFQSSDWSNSEKTAKLGKALNAKFISRGKIMKLGSNLSISASVIDIQTAEIVASTNKVSYENIDELVSYFFLASDTYGYYRSGKIEDLVKDVAYSRGPAGGLVFHFDGQYFYEAVFLTERYVLSDASKRHFNFGGYSNWHFPTYAEVKLIAINLISREKHEEIEGSYWMWDYGDYVYLSSRCYNCHSIEKRESADTERRICLVRKFTDE